MNPEEEELGDLPNDIILDAVIHVVRYFGSDGQARIRAIVKGEIPQDTMLGMLELAKDILKVAR